MPQLSVGYQYNEKVPFPSITDRYKNQIEEVYFSWVDSPSGRAVVGACGGYVDYRLQGVMLQELRQIQEQGIKLDLLFNANCYGEDAMSESLCQSVCSVIEYLREEGLSPSVVTTTSPAIAHMVRTRYEDIELRASVNMRIGSVKGMQYVAHLFDSFCVAKECNRDIPRLRAICEYARTHGKRISILANSGCMRDCSGQIFHDNMVAHEAQIAKQKNIAFMPYTCWNYLKDASHFPAVLQNTWIRPEDIHRYDGLVDLVKLATRTHDLPGMVIAAYARGEYFGNLLDLFEPSFTAALLPRILNSAKLPYDFWQRTTECDKDCDGCTYCRSVFEAAVELEH